MPQLWWYHFGNTGWYFYPEQVSEKLTLPSSNIADRFWIKNTRHVIFFQTWASRVNNAAFCTVIPL